MKYRHIHKKIKILKKLSDKIYNLNFVLKVYCSSNLEAENIYNIYPLVEYIHERTDKLNFELMNFFEECD